MNEVIKYIYNNMIYTIFQGFSEDEFEEISKAYLKKLIQDYSNIERFGNDIDKIKEKFLRLEQIEWQNKTKQEKQVLLLKDEYLDKIGHISDLALKYALLRLKGKLEEIDITSEQAEKYISMMKEYLPNVRDFNKNIALEYLSNGSMDFEYAVGLTENKSLRVGRML